MGLVSEMAPCNAAGYRVFDIRTEARAVQEVLVNRPAEGTTPQLPKRSFRSLRRGGFGLLSTRPASQMPATRWRLQENRTQPLECNQPGAPILKLRGGALR
jgi:hypothetical protein